MHFGAFWSNFGHGMDNICLEQCGWTKLKTQSKLGIYQREEENKFKSRKEKESKKKKD